MILETAWVEIGALLLVGLSLLFGLCFTVVSHGHVVVVERLGKLSRVGNPGLVMLFPWIDTVRKVRWTLRQEGRPDQILNTSNIRTIPTNFDFSEVAVTTQDQMSVRVNGMMTFSIKDPVKAVYSCDDLYLWLNQVHMSVVAEVVCRQKLDDLINTGMTELAGIIFADLRRKIMDNGLDISSYVLQYIRPSDRIMKAKEEAVCKKREAEAELLRVRAESEVSVLKAESEARALTAKANSENSRKVAAAQTQKECDALKASSHTTEVQALVDVATKACGKPLSEASCMEIFRHWSDRAVATTLANSPNTKLIPHGALIGRVVQDALLEK